MKKCKQWKLDAEYAYGDVANAATDVSEKEKQNRVLPAKRKKLLTSSVDRCEN